MLTNFFPTQKKKTTLTSINHSKTLALMKNEFVYVQISYYTMKFKKALSNITSLSKSLLYLAQINWNVRFGSFCTKSKLVISICQRVHFFCATLLECVKQIVEFLLPYCTALSRPFPQSIFTLYIYFFLYKTLNCAKAV